jgi:hypothetical protein
MNQIYDNTSYNARALSGNEILAEGNWWGTDPPNVSKISGTVDYTPWMRHQSEYPPTGSWGDGEDAPIDPEIIAGVETMTMDELTKLKQARESFLKGEYGESKQLYKDILSGSENTETQSQAIVGLYQIFCMTRDISLVEEARSHRELWNDAGITAGEILYNMYAALGRYDDSRSVAESLIQRHPDSETEMHALIHLAALRGFTVEMEEVSQKALAELTRKYGTAIDKGLLAALGGDPHEVERFAGDMNDKENDPEELSLTSYPNPFNPATTLHYSLPSKGHIVLKIYDVLGREVKVLVDEYRDAGSYNVTFDASRLPSGVYFSRIDFAGQSLVQRMLLVK